MITAKLLKQVWEESFLDRRPYDVLTLCGYTLPDLSDVEAWEEPELDELGMVTNDLAMRVARRADYHPLSIFTTGICLGYLSGNKETLEGMHS